MKRSPKTAEEFQKELDADQEYQTRRRAQDEKIRELQAALAAEERPLVAALQDAGLACVRSVWDLVNTAEPYPQVLGILVEHLQKGYSTRITAGIGRALAVPGARQYWPILLPLFLGHPDGSVPNLGKFGIGCALAASFSEEHLDDVIAILEDPAHGENRAVFLPCVARLKSPKATVALEKAARDPQLKQEAKFQLQRRERRSRPTKH